MTRSEKCKSAGLKSLADYIDENHEGNKSAFARKENVSRQLVNQWINQGYIVADNKLCSVRRNLARDDS